MVSFGLLQAIARCERFRVASPLIFGPARTDVRSNSAQAIEHKRAPRQKDDIGTESLSATQQCWLVSRFKNQNILRGQLEQPHARARVSLFAGKQKNKAGGDGLAYGK